MVLKLQGVASRACCTFQEKLQSVASRPCCTFQENAKRSMMSIQRNNQDKTTQERRRHDVISPPPPPSPPKKKSKNRTHNTHEPWAKPPFHPACCKKHFFASKSCNQTVVYRVFCKKRQQMSKLSKTGLPNFFGGRSQGKQGGGVAAEEGVLEVFFVCK